MCGGKPHGTCDRPAHCANYCLEPHKVAEPHCPARPYVQDGHVFRHTKEQPAAIRRVGHASYEAVALQARKTGKLTGKMARYQAKTQKAASTTRSGSTCLSRLPCEPASSASSRSMS